MPWLLGRESWRAIQPWSRSTTTSSTAMAARAIRWILATQRADQMGPAGVLAER